MTCTVALRAALPLAVSVLLGLPTTLRAQAAMGRVVDSASRRPLPGVPVRLVRVTPDSAASADSTLPSARTGADGTFSLLFPAPGRYRVRLRDEFDGPVLVLATTDTVDEHLYVIPAPDANRAYGPSEVDRQVGIRDGLSVRYPVELHGRGLAGCAALQFVVDPNGRMDRRTLRVLAASHREFADAAAAAVVSARYQAAERGGQPVRAVMRLPVTFSIVDGPRYDRAACVNAASPGAADLVAVEATRSF